MSQCPRCGRRFAPHHRVCPEDGSLLENTLSTEERAIGKTLDGKYRIEGFVKKGGMGAVYRGTHLMLTKPVAIKLIKPELVSSNDVVERFLREARAAAQLRHPYIVTVHDLGQARDGTLYIVMELVYGQSLKETIQAQGPLALARARRLISGVASALAAAHKKGIVHRDLKPQNIMISRDGEGNEIPMLLDFGIAKTLEPDGPALTSTGMVIGTPQYMSAEQAKGLPADPRSDIYALGVILYEMLVGKVPFDDKSIPSILVKHLSEPPRPPSSVRHGIPRELEEVVLRCLEKVPEKRFQSAEELGTAIAAIAETRAPAGLEPTLAMTGASADVSSPPGTPPSTMAGAASASAQAGVPAVPPEGFEEHAPSQTVRAHEIRAASGRRSRGRRLIPWVALAAVLILGVALAARVRSRRSALRDQSPGVALPHSAEEANRDEVASNASTPPVRDSDPIAEPPAPSPARAEAPAPPAPEPASRAEAPTSPGPPEAERGRAMRERAPPVAPSRAEGEAIPENATVAVECEGLRDACALLRLAIRDALSKEAILVTRPARAEVFLYIVAEEIESRTEEQFGTTFVVRTYSIDATAEVPRFDDSVTLLPRTFSFDARLGRERLREQLRVSASELAARLSRYWAAKRAE